MPVIPVIRYLVVSLVICVAGQGELRAKGTQALVISLDVPEERAPEWLCVITTESCKDPSSCLAGELRDLGLRLHGGWRYGFEAASPARKLPLPVEAALRALRRPALSERENLCSREDQNGCQPEIDLRQFRTEASPSQPSRLAGRVVCGARPGAESVIGAAAEPTNGKIKRVAFIGLTFGDPVKDGSGIQEINFVGTTANITFERPLPRDTVTFAQVVGGDYAPSEASAIGNNENVLVRLRPRCNRFVAELPGHVAPIGAVTISSEALDRELACSAPKTSSRALAIEVPYTSTSAEKKLAVELATAPTSISEASWTEALPPVPLKLGARSLQFSWRRPIGCLADRWSEATPRDERTWSQSCPRATLSDSTVCEVISTEPPSPDDELPACEYQCTVDARFAPLALPVQVRFERIRAKGPGPRTEIIYGWSDQIAYSGQILTSMVAPNDRRIMLELTNPFAWNDSWGDQLDAIRIVSGRSSDQIDLTARPRDAPMPRWVSLATPGRTCSDRVRVVVVGTKRYDEKTFEADRGRITLGRPLDFRFRARGYVLGGGGFVYQDTPMHIYVRPTLDLGIGIQKDVTGPWSVNAELLGRLFWAPKLIDEDTVPYVQGELRAGLEWWITRRFGVAGFVGLGAATPVRDADRDDPDGSARFSMLMEIDPMSFTLWPSRIWLLWGAGLRVHEGYKVSDVGEIEPFTTLKLRGLLGL